MFYRWLADVVVALHVGYVACVVVGVALILLGRALAWGWVRNRWFRLAHLLLIVTVVIRAMLMPVCPLTTWEEDLRRLGGQEDFEGSRVGYVLHAMIHPDLPLWVFPLVYVAFGALVVCAFWLVPVRWRPEKERPPEPVHGKR
jgi:hypothetical protein